MTTDEYFSHIAETFNQALELCHSKCADYAGDDDPFRNFRLVESAGLCSTPTGILVRMSDKFSRICNLLSDPKRPTRVTDESVQDTLRDLINYSAILLAYLESKSG